MTYVEEYLANLTDDASRNALQHIRDIVHELASPVAETKGYGIPTFRYKGKNLVHFAAYKDHLSLFPASGAIAAYQKELAGFTQSKGTIQFTAERPIPDALLKKIILHRKADIDAKS
jgi:uncharacterized protein YdhG (YjbR/CyaY superfamily)